MQNPPVPGNQGGGAQDGAKGIEFQKRILQLYSVDAFNKSKEFKCWTEDPNAEKFDDVVIEFKDTVKSNFSFLQAKHKVNPQKLTFLDFISNEKYQLHKYFESYVEIENNFKIDDKTNNIDNVIIATNNTLPLPGKMGILKLSDLNLTCIEFKLEIVKNQEALANISTSYAFSKSHESENFENLKKTFLAIELLQILFKKPSKFHVLRHSRDFLLSNVLDEIDGAMYFKDEFLDLEISQIETFRDIFEKIVEITKNADTWERLPKKLKASDIEDQMEPHPDEGPVDEKLKRFMNKLLIVTELELTKIESAINLRILSQINDISELENFKFQKLFNKWFSDKEINALNPLDRKRIEAVFEVSWEQNQLKQQNIHFKDSHCVKISEFLKLKPKLMEDRILIYQAGKNESFCGLLTLYNLNKSLGYLDTRKWNENSEIFLEIVKSSAEDTCLTLIIEDLANLNAFDASKEKLRENLKVKLVVICDGVVGKRLSGYKKVEQKEILCKKLTEVSLQEYLKRPIQFQGNFEVPLRDLIDSKQLEKIALRELMNLTTIEPLPENPALYIQRSIYRKDFFDKKLLEDVRSSKINEILCFNEAEYELQQKIYSNNPIHLVEKVRSANGLQYLKWKGSTHSADQLTDYLYTITEDEFLTHKDSIYLIAGQAGMGKSSFFENLTGRLKEKYPNRWVQKFNLQAFYNELRLLKGQLNQNDPDDEKICQFFSSKFLKFKSESNIKLKIFINLIRQGRAILLLDGFDEISGDYKDTVIALVQALIRISQKNRIFLSTRPEWSDELENKLLEKKKLVSHWFHPFSKKDQIRFLKSLWEKDDSWDHFVKSILKKINKAEPWKQKSSIGIPLVTSLVGELFKERVKDLEDAKNGANILKELEGHSMVDLLRLYTAKLFELYMERYIIVDYDHNRKKIEDIHKKLAFSVLFPKYFAKIFSDFKKFDDEERNILTRCGLVRGMDGKFMFYHQTTAEFLIAMLLLDKLENPVVLKIIFKVVLVESGHQIVRLYLNESISKIISVENKILVKNFVLSNIQILNVAARESNLETFNALFDVITEDLTGCCAIRRTKKLLMSKDENGLSIFYNLFSNCNVPIEDFLEKLERKFDIAFIEQILLTSNGKFGLLTLGAVIRGEDFYKVLSSIFKKFVDKPEFMEQFPTAMNQRCDILHLTIENSNIDSLVSVLDDLKSLEDSSKGEFVEKIILHRDREQKTFIQKILDNLDKSKSKAENFEAVLKVVGWVHQDTSCLENLILSRDVNGKSLIFYLLKRFNVMRIMKFIKFLQDLPDFPTHKLDKKDLISKFVLEQSSKRKTFIQIFMENFDKSKSDDENFKIILKVLGEVHQSTGCIKELIESKDKNDKTLIFYVAGKFGTQKFMKFIEVVNDFLNSAPFLHHEIHEKDTFLVYYSKPDINIEFDFNPVN